MGLNERRKIKELQEITLPSRTKEIEEISGKPVPYDVAWDTFAEDAGALNFVDNVACHRLNMALRVICQDAMGKDAVRDGLKVVKITNVKTPDEKKLGFEAGTLSMTGAYGQGLSGAFSDGEIRELLTAKL
jgi:hypothetical protein